MKPTHNTPNAAERPSDAAILQWLLDHSYLNNGLIDYGAGFTQQRPGIIKGALIDTMNGWHGECQFCRGGQELYADGNPSGEACSHCKGKGNVNELRADDIFYYYEAIAELDSHRPAESVSAEPVAELEVTERQHGRFAKAYPTRYGLQTTIPVGRYPLYLHPQPSAPGAVSDEDARRAMEAYRDAFKNFHRSLCARFGYTHDKLFWWRDLVSLEEHIAKLAAPPAQAVSVGVPESVRYAVERMSIDPTWLKGVTAQEDARCMLIIADFISSLSAAPAAATREGKE